MERFIEFGPDKAIMLNNADWLLKLNYVELLREVGACFSVNNMLRAPCYEQRMEKGLSFLEFNYMICLLYTSMQSSLTGRRSSCRSSRSVSAMPNADVYKRQE